MWIVECEVINLILIEASLEKLYSLIHAFNSILMLNVSSHQVVFCTQGNIVKNCNFIIYLPKIMKYINEYSNTKHIFYWKYRIVFVSLLETNQIWLKNLIGNMLHFDNWQLHEPQSQEC